MNLKFVLALLLLVLYSCKSTKNSTYLKERYGEHEWLISTNAIRIANRLQKESPGASFHIISSKERVHFERNPSKSELTLDGTDEQLESPVIARLKVEKEFLSLQDMESFSETVFESNQVKLLYAEHSYSGYETIDSAWINTPRLSIPVSEDGIFLNDAYETQMVYANPGVGTRLSLRYELEFRNVFLLNKFLFAEEYQCATKLLEIDIPDWLEVSLELRNNFYEIETTNIPRKYSTQVNYHAKVVQPFKRIRRGLNQAPSILISYLSFQNKDGEIQPLMGNTNEMFNWYSPFVSNLEVQSDTIKKLSSVICAGSLSNREKVQRLFYWVQDHINYLAFENGVAGFKPEQAEVVLLNRYGDCKGMSNLLRCMLLSQGFEANLVWIGTNSTGKDYRNPGLGVDNHMICRLKLEGKPYYLDATETFIGLDQYAVRIQGRPCLVNLDETYIIDTIPNIYPESNIYQLKADLKIEKDQLIGQFSLKLEGESKRSFWNFRQNVERKEQDYLTNLLANLQIENAQLSDLKYDKELNREAPFKMSSEISLSKRVFNYDSFVVLNLQPEIKIPLNNIDTNDFGDVYLGEISRNTSEVTFDLTDSFEIRLLPDSLLRDNDWYSLNFSYQLRGSKLTLYQEVKIKESRLPIFKISEYQEDYAALLKFYNSLILLNKK